MILPIPKVLETKRRFRLEADVAWWSANRELFRDPDTRLMQSFVLDLEGYRLGQRLLFRGAVRGVVEIPCGRCVEPYAHAFDDALQLLLEPLPAPDSPEHAPEGGIELDPEDLEIGRYSGDELDFGVVLREILHFNWPMQPRCGEDCRGLCPLCGANRNTHPCECEGEARPRPFAELGELLSQSKSRSS